MSSQDPYVREPYTFDRVVRILFTVVTIFAVIVLLAYLKGVLLPFLVACLIAYMLEPLVAWNQRWTHTRSRFIPVVLTLLETCSVIAICAAVFIPYVVSEGAEMSRLVKQYAATQTNIPYISSKVQELLRENISHEQVTRFFSQDEWASLLKNALSSSWSFLSSGLAIVMGALSWLIVILYVIFIMLDYERIMLSFRQLVPMRHRDRTYRVMTDVKNAMNRYFRGQALIAALVGVLFSIGFIIIGLPMGVVLGLFIGVLNLVPYLQLLSLPVTAVLCIVCTASSGTDFWVIFWESMAVYVVVQCIQDLWLTPKIMGKAMGLNPAIILLSLSIWGTLLGFMGLIIALPMTTLLISYYDLYIVNQSKRQNQC